MAYGFCRWGIVKLNTDLAADWMHAAAPSTFRWEGIHLHNGREIGWSKANKLLGMGI